MSEVEAEESRIGSSARPLRVAVIGSGPAGFYACTTLLGQKDLEVQVDLFDRLPTPFGLVRGGVAPDHQKIKSVTRVYEKTADRPGFRFFGNVELGRDVKVADLELDPWKREVRRGDVAIPLQAREFALLEFMMRNRDRVVSKTSILENVYDYDFDPQTNVVDVLVCRLRNKIDREFDSKRIHTIRGMGYVLKSE